MEKVWMQVVRTICLLLNFGLYPGKQIPSLRKDFHTLSCWKKCCLIAYPISFFFYSIIYILWVKQVPFLFSFFISFSTPPPCSLPPLLIPSPLSFLESTSPFFNSLFWRLEIQHWKHIIKYEVVCKQSSDIFGYHHGMGTLGHLSYDFSISIEHTGPSNAPPQY